MCSHVPNKGEQPVESPSAVRHFDEPLGLELEAERLVSSRSESNGLQVERYDGIKTYTLDIAATGIEAKKQSAKMIHKGCEYYMPIVGHIKENALVLGDEFREGNITPATRNLYFIKYCVSQMPKCKRIKALRSDSVAYQAEIINYCEQNRIQCAVEADCEEAVLEAIKTISNEDRALYKNGSIAETTYFINKTKHSILL